MIGVETIIESDGWRREAPDWEDLAARVFTAARACEPRLNGGAALLLTQDEAVRRLNARFRGRDEATNVLAFPSGVAAPGFLGDIALAYETCAREARDKGVSVSDHAAHLIAHGLLHLVGYDHMDDADADAMERVEAEILDGLGVSNPYGTEETIE